MKLIKINLKDLVPDKEQPRKEFLEIDELAESLTAKGQLSPITVSRDNKILDGHRRYYAAKKAGITHLEANMILKKLTPFREKALPFAINIERHGFNPHEMAESICDIYWNFFLEEYEPKTRVDNGYSEFARYMGLSTTVVSSILKIHQLAKKSRQLQKAMKEKEISYSTIKEIAMNPVEEHFDLIRIAKADIKKNPYDRGKFIRDKMRDKRFDRKLEKNEELSKSYINRIYTKAGALKSLLSENVIRLITPEQTVEVQKMLKPIVKFNKRLK